MDPVKLTIDIYIPEPLSNDIDELTDLVMDAMSEVVGKLDYAVADIGLSFEIDDE